MTSSSNGFGGIAVFAALDFESKVPRNESTSPNQFKIEQLLVQRFNENAP